MTRLEGKVAIITGAAQGMGASHARRFVAEGAKVVITDLNEEKGTALASELGENVLFVKQMLLVQKIGQLLLRRLKKNLDQSTS